MDTQNKYCGYIIRVERDKIYSPQAWQNHAPRFTDGKIRRTGVGSNLKFYLKSKSDFSLE